MQPASSAALPAAATDVFEALATRRSVRAFLPKPVDRRIVEQILALASRAPSGSNIQPWKVWVVAGAAKDSLCARILDAHRNEASGHAEEYRYYPRSWEEPYLSRRRKIGFDLYSLLGIAKADRAAMQRQFGRNYDFFGAPVGLFLGIDRSMELGGWFDLGGFLQSILLAARGFGLHSCPQQAFAKYHRLIRAALDIDDDQMIACGVALGYEDPEAAENRLVTEREPVAAFARFFWE